MVGSQQARLTNEGPASAGLLYEETITLIEGLPLPAQLTLIGALIMTLVGVLIYQNRLVQNGKLVPRETVDKSDAAHAAALLAKDAEYQRMEKLLTDQVAAERIAKGEWRSAHGVSEAARGEERDINRGNSEAIRVTAHFFESMAPKRDMTPNPGDNGVQGGGTDD